VSFFAELKRRNVFKVGIAYLVTVWLLIQVADILLENIGAPAWVLQTLFVVLGVGFFITLFFAWAFEMTPEGVKREKEIDRSQSIAPQTGKKLNNTILILMALAIAYLLFDKLSVENPVTIVATETAQNPPTGEPVSELEPESAILERSIAVLPFENFSGDPSDQYFADGLADTLLHKLAQISDLKVIARNSSFQFKGTNKDVREIGKILNVRTILEGSVQRAGNQVRIIAQLINTSDGVHLWSQSFDGSMEDIFTLQDQVAADIVAQLQVNISKEEQARLLRNGTDNPEAYDLLMRATSVGRNLDQMTDVNADTWEPLQLLLDVVKLDPQYAEAWAHLAFSYSGLAFASDSAEDYDRYVSQSRAAAEKSLELDPNLANGHEAMGWVEHRNRETLKAARHFRRALELNPNSAGAMAGLGLQLGRIEPEEALRLFTRSQELDPSATIAYRQKHFALMALGRTEEAIEQLELAVEAAPDQGIYYNDLSDLLIARQGRPDEAARQISRLLQLSPRSFEGVDAMVEAWTAATEDSRASAWIEVLMTDRSDSDSAKLLNARRLLTAARYGDALQQLDSVQENQSNAWNIVSLRLSANLGLKDSAKAAEYAIQFRKILSDTKARGAGIPAFDIFVAMMELLTWEQSKPGFDAKEMLRNMPPLENIPFLSSSHYLLAGIQERMGNTEKAMALLELALAKPDGGVFNTDRFGFSVEQSLLLNPLRGKPEFEDWMSRYRERRDAMLQRMLEMESRGEIIEASMVKRMIAP